ncbi:hypothetical protein K490DRAFT_23960, partial [Saccharata proteae CBS 121410]
PAPKGRLSLYAHLLGGTPASAPGTISSAPVMYGADGNEDSAAKKPTNSALQFMPSNLKRPQPKKPTLGKPRSLPTSSSSPDPGVKAAQQDAQPEKPTVKTTLADWTSVDDDVNGFYAQQPKQQRGGRAGKKRKMKEQAQSAIDWNDIYDPSRPTNYEAYIHSEEKFEAEREWKEYLYASRMSRRKASSEVPDEEPSAKKAMHQMFAPPSAYDAVPTPSPPAAIPDDATGEDAFARRMRMSAAQPQSQSPQHSTETSPKPSFTQLPPPASASAAALSSSATITRAPVFYKAPEAPASPAQPPPPPPTSAAPPASATISRAPEGDDRAPRPKRPGQESFAKRLLQKYGWTEGTGLGAKGTGIVTPLSTRVEKQKKRAPGQAGPYKSRGGKGTIVGGKKSKAALEEEKNSKFGVMSEVVVMWGMVDGLDLDEEMSRGEGGILQEIGEECNTKYGNVERVFIDRNTEADTVPVFVKFIQALSALRAVNDLDGRIFNGNTIAARYFDTDRFDNGDY